MDAIRDAESGGSSNWEHGSKQAGTHGSNHTPEHQDGNPKNSHPQKQQSSVDKERSNADHSTRATEPRLSFKKNHSIPRSLHILQDSDELFGASDWLDPQPSEKSLTRLQKELAPFNKDARPSGELALGYGPTRRSTRALVKLAQNEIPSPVKNLSFAKLMAAASKGMEEGESIDDDFESVPSDDESSSIGDAETIGDDDGGANHSIHGERSREVLQKPRETTMATARIASRKISITQIWKQDLREWRDWDREKKQVKKLLNGPGCNTLATSNNLPVGYDSIMEAGVWVFSPILDVFNDFANFLQKIEELAGREWGAVKVVPPKRKLTRPALGSMKYESLPVLPALEVRLTQRKLRTDTIRAYQTVYSPATSITASAHEIEKHRTMVVAAWGLSQVQKADAWRESVFENTYTEEQMIQQMSESGNSSLCTIDIEANDHLRYYLGCGNPRLTELAGNSFNKSISKAVAGVQSPRFLLSQSAGVPFAMHLKEAAAYSLNYLHMGAPRIWTIVKPTDHDKLQELMHYVTADSAATASNGKRTRYPPQCDQSLGHESLYVPAGSLQLLDVEYTVVVQHQGELVITFPYAFCQVYCTGPSIAEEISYTTDRWEVFVRRDLYQKCHQSCPRPWRGLDLGFFKTLDGTLHTDERKKSGDSISTDYGAKKRRHSPEDSGHGDPKKDHRHDNPFTFDRRSL